jgi:hypothetical protein
VADVFISYAKPSQHLAVSLGADLTKAGFTVWLDGSLLSGNFVAQTIARELAQAKVVVVIWSPEAVQSQWVYSEADRARKAGKLVQLVTAAVDQSLIPPPFDVLHLVPFEDRAAIFNAIDHLGIKPSRAPLRIGSALAPNGDHAAMEDSRPNVATSIRLQLWRLLQSNQDLRVSFSALLRIANAGEYLIIRNLHRHEVFAPIGGVYKYYDSAGVILDSLEFRPESTAWPDDVTNDIRGFLPCRHALEFRRWFGRGDNREDAQVCLRRELTEELTEIDLASRIGSTSTIRFEMVRRVEEAPRWANSGSFFQYRIFDVYQPIVTDPEPRKFLRDLFNIARAHDDLDLVTADEIKSGRSKSGRVIGHHAAYLFGDRAYRPDAPMYSDRTQLRTDNQAGS